LAGDLERAVAWLRERLYNIFIHMYMNIYIYIYIYVVVDAI